MAVRGIRAICFDVDDTLVDFSAAVPASLAAMLAHLGIAAAPDPQLWGALTGAHYPRYLKGEIDFAAMQLARLAGYIDTVAPGIRIDWRKLESVRARALRASMRVFDDVPNCLDALSRQGLSLGLITNSDGPHQRAKLSMLGLDRGFAAVVISGEIGSTKPDPAIFWHACKALRVEPDEAMHVGDNRDVDVRGATTAGMHGVWLDRAGGGPVGGHRIGSLNELSGLLTDLQKTL